MAKYGRFVSHFYRSNAVIIFNGLIALGTMAVLILHNIFAFKCPCSMWMNFDYGLTAICAPAGLFFLIGILMNRSTWNLVSECRLRKCQKLSGASSSALLGSIMGRAMVAPLTWVVASLFEGRAYACAFSTYVDPVGLDNFPTNMGSGAVAKLPCASVTGRLGGFWADVEGQLKHDSRIIAWMVLAAVSLTVLLFQCIKHCACPVTNRHEDYWSQYRSSENTLFQRTSAVHAHLLAAENVKKFFGFVVLDEEEKGQLAEYQSAAPICSTEWNRVTGVDFYTEKSGLPLYSRLNNWATHSLQKDVESKEEEMLVLG